MKNEILSVNPHLVVIKSISKSYGVPGFRIGVIASGDIRLISQIKDDVSIWNINSFAEFYMQIYEKYHKDYIKACGLFREERSRFMKELAEIPFLRVIPTQANYFLCELITDKYSSKDLAVRLLADYNILVKDCSGKAAFNGKNYIRLAVRDRKDNDYLISVLKGL